MTEHASKNHPVNPRVQLRIGQIEQLDKSQLAAGTPLKYLLFKISDGRSKTQIMRFGAADPEHKHIEIRTLFDPSLTRFKIAAEDGISNEGGGFIRYNEQTNTIRLWGMSLGFGAANLADVRSLLKGAYGNEIRIEYGVPSSILQYTRREENVKEWVPIEKAIAESPVPK